MTLLFSHRAGLKSRRLLQSILLVGGVLAALTGCTTPGFYANVTTFRQESFVLPEKTATFAFIRFAEQEQSLEQRDIEAHVASELGNYNFRVGPRKTADFLVSVQASIDDGKLVTRREPDWDMTYRVWSRPVYDRRGRIIGFFPEYYPAYGVTNYRTYTETVYTRQLHVDIYDRKRYDAGDFAKLYEGTAVNFSTSYNLTTASFWLARALFKNFPGNNGKTEQVQIAPMPEQQK